MGVIRNIELKTNTCLRWCLTMIQQILTQALTPTSSKRRKLRLEKYPADRVSVSWLLFLTSVATSVVFFVLQVADEHL